MDGGFPFRAKTGLSDRGKSKPKVTLATDQREVDEGNDKAKRISRERSKTKQNQRIEKEGEARS